MQQLKAAIEGIKTLYLLGRGPSMAACLDRFFD